MKRPLRAWNKHHCWTTTMATKTPPNKPSLAVLKAQAELAERLLSKRQLMPFVKRFNPKYKDGWVHRDICRRLERFSRDVAEGKSPRLMLLMPPRHGKSELVSRNFPAWHLGQHPDHEFIACSYNLSLAMDFSRKVKQIIGDPLYSPVFDTALDPNNQSTESWGVAGQRGGYVAAGIGGPITGKGAHCLVIDDPIKNAEEADSADTREKIWEWYLSTAYSRLAPGGGVLIIQTWWHDDDLSGRLQTMMKNGHDDQYVDQFEVIKYPAIAEADEWLNQTTDLIEYVHHDQDLSLSYNEKGEATAVSESRLKAHVRALDQEVDTTSMTLLRVKGEALHTERYDLDKLLRIKAQNGGGRWWSALYQQNPVPADGAYFLKSQFQRSQPPSLQKSYVYMAWDFAISEKKQSDYTVGTVGLQDENDVLHVVDQVRFKSGNAFFIVESILNLAMKWHNATLMLGFEDGQIWRAIEALLKKRMRERKFYPAIVVLKPITDKMARARPLQGRMQQGMVSFNTNAEWFDPLRAEMLRFPAGAHDDQVDSLAWMAQMVIGREAPRKTEVKPMKSWKDKLRVSNNRGSAMTA
jgi:predicted phage terminase large subunit-like protein